MSFPRRDVLKQLGLAGVTVLGASWSSAGTARPRDARSVEVTGRITEPDGSPVSEGPVTDGVTVTQTGADARNGHRPALPLHRAGERQHDGGNV